MKAISFVVLLLSINILPSNAYADADDVKWIAQCMKDNANATVSRDVVRKYCSCMNDNMDDNETQSITVWAKTHSSEQAGCFARAGWTKTDDQADEYMNRGYTNYISTPIFSELVMFTLPAGFKIAFTNTNGNSYIQESVPNGESTDQWSQMITITGGRGLAANENMTPQSYLEKIATLFKRACPDTFAAKGIGSVKVGGHDAFIGLIGCGTVRVGSDAHSEAALYISIKGSNDYYTFQWAERGAGTTKPIDLNSEKWADRSKKLTQIRFCTLTPGESAPFPSCVDKK